MYLTFKAKITTDKKTEAILNNLCFSATKLYNTINWRLRNEWQYNRALCDYCDTIGYPHNGVKIPLSRTELQTQFKDNHWAKNIHSQSAQFIIGEVINAYKSWFAHRKNGNGNAKPPGFRRKTSLSPVTFVQGAPSIERNPPTPFGKGGIGKTSLRLSLGTKRLDSLKEITFKIAHRKYLPEFSLLRNVKITYDIVTGTYYAHLVFDVLTISPLRALVNSEPRQLQLFPTNVVAVDLGLNNIITATFSDGTTSIISGRELKAIRRYWQKVRTKVKPPSVTSGESGCRKPIEIPPAPSVPPFLKGGWGIGKGGDRGVGELTTAFKRKPSKRHLQICRKEARQIAHRLHIISKQFIELCDEKGVTHIVLGDLTGIRENIDYSKKLNQQLHNWPFAKLVDFLSYKAKRVGITVELINEEYTSQTCCKCGVVKKSNRKTRGLYICDCSNRINADRNGANNILRRYLRDRSSGSVALPVVTLVLQRTDAHCLRIYNQHSIAS